MSHNSDMIKMLRLVEGQQFAGEPGQQAGDQVRGIEKAAKNGQQHPFHSRLVGEEISLEDKLSKKYQDMKDLHGKEVAEVSDNALKSYQQKVSSDSMKHKADPTKRSPEKANRSVAGFAKAQNRLEQGVAEGLNEFAPPERGDGQENRFNFIEEFESDDGKYVIELYRNVESRSFAVSFHRDNMQYVMYPIDGIDAGDLADGADRYVKEIKKNAAHGSQEDFVALGSTDLEVFIPPEQGVAEDVVTDFVTRGGQIQQGKLHKPRKGETWQGSSHIGAAGGRGTKGTVSGRAANTNPKGGKPVVTAEGSVAKKPQPYNDPNWAKKLPKEKLDAIAGPRYKKDKKEQGVAEGEMSDQGHDAPADPGNEHYAKLQARLKELEARFDPNFEYSDDHSVWSRHNKIYQEIQHIKRQLSQGKINEDQQESPMEGPMLNRIMMRHMDLIEKYGIDLVLDSVRDVADSMNIGPDDEIGTSDVSAAMVNVMNQLKSLDQQIDEYGSLPGTSAEPVAGTTAPASGSSTPSSSAGSDEPTSGSSNNTTLSSPAAAGVSAGGSSPTTPAASAGGSAVKPGVPAAPQPNVPDVPITPDEKSALDRIRANAGLKTQFDNLLKQVQPKVQ